MRKIILVAASFAALVVPSAAMAAQPDGTYTIEPKASANANLVGQYSSRITQNGQFVGGNKFTSADQTTSPGSRAVEVQSLLGH